MNWKVFIVCSKKSDIDFNYYKDDPFFSAKNYAFFNVGEISFSIDGFQVVNSSEIPGYVRLGRKFAESEVLYNVARLNLFQEIPFIGFMHYDFRFFDKFSTQSNITELIDASISSGIDFVSFFTGVLGHVVGYYNVLLDERKPNCLFVRDSGLENPKSVNMKIVEDIYRLLGKRFPIEVDSNSKIALCCSFLAKREWFDDIGKLIVDMVDSHCLDGFDTQDKHRFPGQVAERYVALYSLLHKKACFQLDHQFIGGQIDLQRDKNAENY